MYYKRLLVVLLFLTAIAKAQQFPVDPSTNQIVYTEVVTVDGANKNDLYGRATTWFSKTFGSAKLAIDVQDKEAGKLIGKVNIPVTVKTPVVGQQDAGVVWATITILSKDNKYKYSIENLTHEKPMGRYSDNWVSGGPLESEKSTAPMMKRPSNWEWKRIKEGASEKLALIVESLKKTMAKPEADF